MQGLHDRVLPYKDAFEAVGLPPDVLPSLMDGINGAGDGAVRSRRHHPGCRVGTRCDLREPDPGVGDHPRARVNSADGDSLPPPSPAARIRRGVTIALSSSNTAVATVPASVTVAAGASTAAIAVTTIAQGSATLTATLDGSSVTSPTLTATAGVALASLSLNASTVVGGNPVTGR